MPREEQAVMKTIRFIGVVVLLIVTVSADVLAYREGGDRGSGYGYGPDLDDRVMTELNLTADQEARIVKLRAAHARGIQPLQNELDSRRRELKELWLQRSLDQDRIAAVEREVRILREKIRGKIKDHQRAVFSILTPEQRNWLQALGMDQDDRYGKGVRDRRGMGNPPAMERGRRGY
jgi:Spy/CpxP family protein refolding chaperone